MTMTKPEMDVVRFSESDVIVASSNDTLGLKYMNNQIAGDAKIAMGGKDYSVQEFKDLIDGLGGHTNVSFKKGNNSSSLENLNAHEDKNTITDGIYSKIISGDETIWSWLRDFDNQ